MAISGVERLIQYANELGVEPARSPRRAETAEPTRRVREPSNDGIKLSLSSAAQRPEAPSQITPPEAPSVALPQTLEEATGSTADAARRGSVVDAYQRPAAAPIGQRIAIRA